MPSSPFDCSIYKHEREGYKLTADTLYAFIYPFKAVLYQKTPETFTDNDLKLRKILLKHYPRVRGTALTIAAIREPPFKVAESQT
jgi:hypothetical protein